MLIALAFRLEWLTIGWMIIEALAGCAAAIQAHSVSLLAFGLDSAVELVSAGVLIWRLSVELKQGQEFSEHAERRASRIGGVLLFVLAAYIVAAAACGFMQGRGEEFSLLGLTVTILAIPIMYMLARRKLAVAGVMGSAALHADAIEAITCGWLSVVVVLGLLAQWIIGAWWIDSVTSLAIVGFLVKEGREAWAGEECGEHGEQEHQG